jgi:hypothetical protein
MTDSTVLREALIGLAPRMKLRLILSVVAVALASTALATVPANAACASNHIRSR